MLVTEITNKVIHKLADINRINADNDRINQQVINELIRTSKARTTITVYGTFIGGIICTLIGQHLDKHFATINRSIKQSCNNDDKFAYFGAGTGAIIGGFLGHIIAIKYIK